ncbi:hypothetical protein [Kutzneria chonburiensis]|uniref:Gfo/Idh/MocA family oxidoreductase n=1 Tax=Kutzneria chonburiensis TaxID=1483604 RepID=A0ABV6MQY5_9PSEU|nr:hypothetical protein [Kutzneria chonburiensis]
MKRVGSAEGGPLRIAVIGLGSIAQKAYLPTLAARPGPAWICT